MSIARAGGADKEDNMKEGERRLLVEAKLNISRTINAYSQKLLKDVKRSRHAITLGRRVSYDYELAFRLMNHLTISLERIDRVLRESEKPTEATDGFCAEKIRETMNDNFTRRQTEQGQTFQ